MWRPPWQQPSTRERAVRLVLIEWEDSHSTNSWEPIEDVVPVADTALICRSVGWLVADGKAAKVLAPHVIDAQPGVEHQACGIMTIPASAVRRVYDMADPRDRVTRAGRLTRKRRKRSK